LGVARDEVLVNSYDMSVESQGGPRGCPAKFLNDPLFLVIYTQKFDLTSKIFE